MTQTLREMMLSKQARRFKTVMIHNQRVMIQSLTERERQLHSESTTDDQGNAVDDAPLMLLIRCVVDEESKAPLFTLDDLPQLREADSAWTSPLISEVLTHLSGKHDFGNETGLSDIAKNSEAID